MDKDQKFAKYIEDYKALIIKVAGLYCADSEDQKDLVQDILLQLWKSFDKYDKATSSLSTWTYRIALNVSISHIRKEKTRQNTQATYLQNTDFLHWDDNLLNERLSVLREAINQLKPLEKAIIILQMEGCPHKEIGDIMGMTISNISTSLYRIKEKLKKQLN
jgi:RNA polymerase sigma-70 factor (ECF subfamily)